MAGHLDVGSDGGVWPLSKALMKVTPPATPQRSLGRHNTLFQAHRILA